MPGKLEVKTTLCIYKQFSLLPQMPLDTFQAAVGSGEGGLA